MFYFLDELEVLAREVVYVSDGRYSYRNSFDRCIRISKFFD